jgi:hypothetical protein
MCQDQSRHLPVISDAVTTRAAAGFAECQDACDDLLHCRAGERFTEDSLRSENLRSEGVLPDNALGNPGAFRSHETEGQRASLQESFTSVESSSISFSVRQE